MSSFWQRVLRLGFLITILLTQPFFSLPIISGTSAGLLKGIREPGGLLSIMGGATLPSIPRPVSPKMLALSEILKAESVSPHISPNILDPPGIVFQTTWGGTGYDYGYGVALDSQENAYVAGYSNSFGSEAVILLKYNSMGSLIWQRIWGQRTGYYSHGYSVAVDSSGSIYVTGQSTAFSAGVFLVKFDPWGNLVWQRTWGYGIGDIGYGVAVDSSGNVFVTGLTYYGGGAVFLLKFSTYGNLLWQKLWLGSGNFPSQGQGLAIDPSNNIYVTGVTYAVPGNGADVLLLKFDPSGNLLLQRTWGSTGVDSAYAVASDSSGNIFVTGTSAPANAGAEHALLLKWDGAGNLLWARTWGVPGTDSENEMGLGVGVDSSHNAYVAGSTSSSVDGTFLLNVDTSGNLLSQTFWGGHTNSANINKGYGIAVDSSGNAFLTGYIFGPPPYNLTVATTTMGSLSYGTTTPTVSLTNPNIAYQPSNGTILTPAGSQTYAGASDAFLFMYGSPTSSPPAFTISSNPTSLTGLTGSSSLSSTITVSSVGGFSSQVTLSVVWDTVAPTGVTPTLTTNPVTPTGTSTLSFTVSSTASTGTYNFHVYGTSGGLTEQSPGMSLTISQTPPPFNFSLANSGGISVAQGGYGSTTIAANLISGTSQSVSLACTAGLPTGASCAFNPPSGNPNFNSILTISTATSTPTGSFTIAVNGTGGSATATTSVILTVNQPFDFRVQNSYGFSVTQGGSGYNTITAALLSGVTQSVGLTCSSGLPSGASCNFATPAGYPTFSSILTINTGSSTPTGSYSITVTGISGTLSRSTSFTLNVTPPLSTPSQPLSLQGTLSSGVIVLTWSAPSFNGGSPIAGYRVYRGTTSGGETFLNGITGNLPSYTDGEVSGGATYFYKVTALNNVGESPPSIEIAVSTPGLAVSISGPSAVGDGFHGVYSARVTIPGSLAQANLAWSVTPSTGSPTTGSGSIFTWTAPLSGSGSVTVTVTASTYGYQPRSASVTVSYGPFTFYLLNEGGITTTPGGSGSTYIDVSLGGGTSQAVTLACTSGLPSQSSCSFAPSSGNPSFHSLLTIVVPSSTPDGSYTITVTGTSGGVSAATSFNLNISTAAFLSNGLVSPQTGTEISTNFDYSVTYTNTAGLAPTKHWVCIDPGNICYEMSAISTSYATGATYTLVKTLVHLGSGSYGFYFQFDDGAGGGLRLPTTGDFTGPTVNSPLPSSTCNLPNDPNLLTSPATLNWLGTIPYAIPYTSTIVASATSDTTMFSASILGDYGINVSDIDLGLPSTLNKFPNKLLIQYSILGQDFVLLVGYVNVNFDNAITTLTQIIGFLKANNAHGYFKAISDYLGDPTFAFNLYHLTSSGSCFTAKEILPLIGALQYIQSLQQTYPDEVVLLSMALDLAGILAKCVATGPETGPVYCAAAGVAGAAGLIQDTISYLAIVDKVFVEQLGLQNHGLNDLLVLIGKVDPPGLTILPQVIDSTDGAVLLGWDPSTQRFINASAIGTVITTEASYLILINSTGTFQFNLIPNAPLTGGLALPYYAMFASNNFNLASLTSGLLFSSEGQLGIPLTIAKYYFYYPELDMNVSLSSTNVARGATITANINVWSTNGVFPIGLTLGAFLNGILVPVTSVGGGRYVLTLNTKGYLGALNLELVAGAASYAQAFYYGQIRVSSAVATFPPGASFAFLLGALVTTALVRPRRGR